ISRAVAAQMDEPAVSRDGDRHARRDAAMNGARRDRVEGRSESSIDAGDGGVRRRERVRDGEALGAIATREAHHERERTDRINNEWPHALKVDALRAQAASR